MCVALVAAAPIVGGIGDLARGPDGSGDPASLGDAWGDLQAASPPEPEPTAAPTDPEDEPEPGERVVQADLLAAPVPSLCGHPEGELEDGLLPGLESGVVWIFANPSGRIPAGRVAYGPLEGGPDTGAAVAVYCDQGGVGWPESVVLYGPGPEYLGHLVLSDLAPGRQKVEWISISRGVVTVRFTETYAPDETGSRGRLDGTVTLRLRDGELVVSEPEFVDERPTAMEALRAASMGDTGSLRTLATSDAATELLRRVEEARAAAAATPSPSPAPAQPTPSDPTMHVLPPGELGIGECTSPLAGAPDGTRATCTLVDADGVVANMHLSRVRFATWQLIEVVAPPSEVVAG
ncbi:MAG: hypothetical protein ACQERF_04245 [Actinomycetota bacterium]